MPTWDELFKSRVGDWKKPAPLILENLASFKQNQVQRVLDLGCGAGRNLLPFAENGFNIHGCDLSIHGITLAKEKSAQKQLNIPLVNCNIVALPYIDQSFDAVISISVINHGLLSDIKSTFLEIYRVLAINGQLMFTVISTENQSFGSGVEIEPNTFITDKGIDAGIVHYFFQKKELIELLRECGFSNIKIKSVSKSELEGVSEGHLLVSCSKS